MGKMIIVEGNNNDKDNVRAIMVKGEKGDQGDLNHNDIIDNLTSTATDKVLSAKQGKLLKDLIDGAGNTYATKTELTQEATTRENDVFNLQVQISNVEETYATKSELTEEATTRGNADTTLQGNIESLEAQISSLASGSPLVASSISGMTDTTKVYVNTSDGKWYYYDGDSWEIGGTYQSTGINENEINVFNLDNNLKENLRYNIPTYTLTDGYYITTGGNISSSSSYSYSSPIALKK